MRPASSSLAALPLLLAPLEAWAQPSPAANATREQLIEQSITAQERGDHAHALELAQRAGATRMTPLLRLFIATELQSLGRTAEALESARRCVAEAEADPAVRNRRAVLRDCQRLVDALQRRAQTAPQQVQPSRIETSQSTPPPPPPPPPPREAFVQLLAPAVPPDGLRVMVQGAEVPAAQWGTRRRVTPGTVRITASAPGRLPFERELVVEAGGAPSVAIQLAPLVPPPPPPPPPRSGPGAGPWIVGGVGVAMLGGALATWRIADGLRGTQQEYCTEDAASLVRTCRDARGVDASEQLATVGPIHNILLFGGAAAVVGGAVWYLVGRASGARRPVAQWRLDVAPSATGVTLGLRGAL